MMQRAKNLKVSVGSLGWYTELFRNSKMEVISIPCGIAEVKQYDIVPDYLIFSRDKTDRTLGILNLNGKIVLDDDYRRISPIIFNADNYKKEECRFLRVETSNNNFLIWDTRKEDFIRTPIAQSETTT